jgi:DNA polymerase I-like protein with 3'-5' exonuclease and polymerase domains
VDVRTIATGTFSAEEYTVAKAPPVTVIDFETHPIRQRPEYPPKPVGVSIRMPGERKSRYWAWGHPAENNCSFKDAKRAFKAAWAHPSPKLFHNSKFDVEVATEHMGVRMLSWEQYHDTFFVLYLKDPHARDLSLKLAAERLLGEAPDERDELLEWILKNTPATKKSWGDYICMAPGGLVGKYACGDTDRTLGLFKNFYPEILERGMGESYDRERELMPILLANEQEGLLVDMGALEEDIALYSAARDKADAWLRKRLKAPSLNIDSTAEFTDLLAKHGIVKDEDWTYTKTGKRSTKKDILTPDMFQDQKISQVYGYRNRLGTCLNMFMTSWYDQAQVNDGRITTNWNQVRQPGGGTRTGRPSTNNHNFLNISKTWDDKEDGYVHPKFLGVPLLPLVRRYVLPDTGGYFCHRDYNQQELRILGHFEDGELMAAYRKDLRMDVHDFVRGLILNVTGREWPRRPVKIVNFRKVYGGGAPAAAAGIGCSLEEAKALLRAHEQAIPGIKILNGQIKALVADDEPIVTWGGREYYVEPPGWNARFGRNMTYEYKLLNYLVQGSAADATKQAIINYHNHPDRRGRFLVTVYDEINVSSPSSKSEKVRQSAMKAEMAVLRDCMESLEFDVPLLSDGKFGLNWGALQKFTEPPSKWEI